MLLVDFSSQFISDLEKLKREDKKLLSKVLELIADILKNERAPLEGIGKPEFLKGNLKGFLSRRIDDKHRLILYLQRWGVAIGIMLRSLSRSLILHHPIHIPRIARL